MEDQEREGRPRQPDVEGHGRPRRGDAEAPEDIDRLTEQEGESGEESDVEAHIRTRAPRSR